VTGEASWRTVLTELESARRHVAQAAQALDRLGDEVAVLREWSDATARLAVARRLCDGPDGGALAALATAASDDAAGAAFDSERAAALLERLTGALGLAPIARRGELLALSAEELGEFDVRGAVREPRAGERGLYCVVRSGWWLGSLVVERPLLEPAGERLA
jgi:hypothetical protein